MSVLGLPSVADVVGYSEGSGRTDRGDSRRALLVEATMWSILKGKLNSHFGYEEVCFLLLLASKRKELDQFCAILRDCYEIPDEFQE